MKKSLTFGFAFALLVVGVMLFVWGVNVSGSVGSDLSGLFTGQPTDNTIWLLIAGVGVTLIGLFSVLRSV
jgi:hypothetical protein